MSWTEILELSDEDIFNMLNTEYEILKEQAALLRSINDIMDQLETIHNHQEQMRLELEMLKMKNISLRSNITHMSM